MEGKPHSLIIGKDYEKVRKYMLADEISNMVEYSKIHARSVGGKLT